MPPENMVVSVCVPVWGADWYQLPWVGLTGLLTLGTGAFSIVGCCVNPGIFKAAAISRNIPTSSPAKVARLSEPEGSECRFCCRTQWQTWCYCVRLLMIKLLLSYRGNSLVVHKYVEKNNADPVFHQERHFQILSTITPRLEMWSQVVIIYSDLTHNFPAEH